ncbi:MAG: cell division protein CrgA [Varibaculum sp.]|nr:cell division protein CrgA [Varibaculum sp.]
MPESRKRKGAKSRAQQTEEMEVRPSWVDGMKLSPSWWAPVMVTLMIIGLIIVVIYYLSSAKYPIPGITHWNLVIGLGVALIGFLMTMRWR